MNEIFLKIKSIIIEKLGVDEKKVIPEASFINDLGADSLDSIELIMEFEKEFQIIISDDDKFMTVDDVNKYIKKYLDYKK
ncbi:acyl carrier protein [Candidatus Karelsulcia muelleri]|uniref:acyl carrier protein n=1 Tax=Candidatus Karelsulcia muelleri TaxID=336810 RepID=UPI00216B306E|nr:acyl carrier protein [Candidatus Karelsulcia muelleri]